MLPTIIHSLIPQFYRTILDHRQVFKLGNRRHISFIVTVLEDILFVVPSICITATNSKVPAEIALRVYTMSIVSPKEPPCPVVDRRTKYSIFSILGIRP